MPGSDRKLCAAKSIVISFISHPARKERPCPAYDSPCTVQSSAAQGHRTITTTFTTPILDPNPSQPALDQEDSIGQEAFKEPTHDGPAARASQKPNRTLPRSKLPHSNIPPISTLQTATAYVADRSTRTDVSQLWGKSKGQSKGQSKAKQGVDRLIHINQKTRPTARGDFSAGRTVPTPPSFPFQSNTNLNPRIHSARRKTVSCELNEPDVSG